jgi:hypothetical protein
LRQRGRYAATITIKEIVMPRPPQRTPNRQLDLFEEYASPSTEGMPTWTTLPDQTRRALTGLMTRLLISHASAVVIEAGSDGDER